MQDPTLLIISITYIVTILLYVVVALPKPTGKITTEFYTKVDLAVSFFLILLFSGLVISTLGASEDDKQAAINVTDLITSIIIQAVFPLLLVYEMGRRQAISEWLGLRWAGWQWVFLIGPGVTVIMLIFMGVLNSFGYMEWMESLGVDTMQDSVKLLKDSSDYSVIALMSFAAVIVAPLCEETLFRGYLYPVAKKFTGPWVGCVVTSLVFAAAHGSLMALLPLFLFAMVLTFLYEKTGSIWAPIVTHLCFNATTVIVQLAFRIQGIDPDKFLQ